MKYVTHVDGIALSHKLYISTEFDVDDYLAAKDVAIDGSTVIFVQAKGAFTREVQLTSKENGWQTGAVKDLLTASVDETVKVLTFSDASVGDYYYDHSKVPIAYDPIFTGSDWYSVVINLVRA